MIFPFLNIKVSQVLVRAVMAIEHAIRKIKTKIVYTVWQYLVFI